MDLTHINILHLQNCFELLELRFIVLELRIVIGVHLGQQKPGDVENLLQLLGRLQLQLPCLVSAVFVKKVKEPTNVKTARLEQ